MPQKIIDIKSISELNEIYEHEKPKHPLISIIDLAKVGRQRIQTNAMYRLHFYSVYLKTTKGAIKYGKAHYDFDEATLIFVAPDQTIAANPNIELEQGWGLFFHPDLLNRTGLGKSIGKYSFFNYDANEALHVSEEEKNTLENCIENIKKEYSKNIDKHTQSLIVSNIELFLNYCDRFYDRQFITRAKVNNDIVQRFEHLLKDYFVQETLIETGLPDVKHFASKLNLSPNYLSDLLQKYTGKSTQEHIHLQLVEKAKILLWSTNKSISEIAFDLGFEYPSHFTKIFKNKTGRSPKEFRNLN
ncbi:helix-turn-helix domain-containing protein [Olivibacter sitiensis]|uniref:helix-turn-helix domain-containing protein n=1 Tax=Olivibacter sitiensis TaxID=376470 RepID=UPI0004131D67|nr:helix-turn-helix domain-containing protein [Olivibacter sitiensis]